ncbi:MAG: helix-turn-helix transcriptional regulator, partial [Firmicutes bacterium]|nr:helix-turn-helix transcriptional regulator [Bacillota bacterium]
MGRVSTKENKTIYQNLREELDLSREKASELLEGITPERLERIENEKTVPHPEEVLLMSDKYKAPDLCNYYCANECPIGEQYVPEVKM